MAVLVNCPVCGKKARIEGRHNITITTSHLYCRCKNIGSGCEGLKGFVFSLSLSHMLKSPNFLIAESAKIELFD